MLWDCDITNCFWSSATALVLNTPCDWWPLPLSALIRIQGQDDLPQILITNGGNSISLFHNLYQRRKQSDQQGCWCSLSYNDLTFGEQTRNINWYFDKYMWNWCLTMRPKRFAMDRNDGREHLRTQHLFKSDSWAVGGTGQEYTEGYWRLPKDTERYRKEI